MAQTKKLRYGVWLLPLLLVTLLSALSLTACTTVPKSVLQLDPASKLEQMPEIYAKIDRIALKDIVESLSDETLSSLANELDASSDKKSKKAGQETSVDRKSLNDLVNRVSVVGLGLSGTHTENRQAEIVLIGNFPAFSVQYTLATKGDWIKTSEGYKAKESPLYIRPLEQGVIHAANFPRSDSAKKNAQSAQFKEVVPSPYKNSPSDFLVVIKSPDALFNGVGVLDGLGSLPISEIVVQCNKSSVIKDKGKSKTAPASEDANNYNVNTYIVMKDAATARMFKPAVRMLWAFSAPRLLGDGANSEAALTLEDDTYKAEGISVSAGALGSMFSQFAYGLAMSKSGQEY